MQDYCPNFQAVVVADAGDATLVSRTRCKMWACPYCAEINRKQWRKRIFDAGESLGFEWSFITLTAHSKAKTADGSLANLQTGWQRLSQRMRRKYGKFHYVRVYELHADGRYHFHALINRHFDDIVMRQGKDGKKTPYSRFMAKAARESSLGWYTHAENMRSVAGASKYITKYMSKSLDVLPKNTRRIQTSQGFPKLVDESELVWKIKTGVYQEDVNQWIIFDKPPIDVQTKHAITFDDFLDTYIYPPEFDDSKEGF